MDDLNQYIAIYKAQLAEGNIQKAYAVLVKYMMKLRSVFNNNHADKFKVGNILQGYMDFTYFYFSTDYLAKQKLKFALVLNHQQMRFEVWLLGRTSDIQKKYWNLLQATKWVKDKTEMPKYAVIESVVVEHPDFNHLELLTAQIESRVIEVADKIINDLKVIASK